MNGAILLANNVLAQPSITALAAPKTISSTTINALATRALEPLTYQFLSAVCANLASSAASTVLLPSSAIAALQATISIKDGVTNNALQDLLPYSNISYSSITA